MRTKPVVIVAHALLLAGSLLTPSLSTSAQAAPPPTLLLYPRTRGSEDDVRALVELRKKLRSDGHFDVLTYDPASASMIRAAGDAHRPELLAGPMTADADRIALTRALGAAFYVVVSKADGRDKADVRLVEAASSARIWNILGEKVDDAAHAIEDQVSDALLHPVQGAVRPAPAKTAVAPIKPLVPALPPVIVATIPSPPPAMTPLAAGPVLAVPGPISPSTIPAISGTAVPSPPPAEVPAPARTTIPVAAVPLKTTIAPPSTPIPTSPTLMPTPARATTVPLSQRSGPSLDDLKSVRSQLRQGDDLLSQGNFVGAISVYRDAVNGAPLSAVPRLKLAQAYLGAGMRDKALDEGRRALQIAPDDASLQQFLMQIDAQSGTADGAVARFDAQVSQNPQDPMAHVDLGDAFWNNNTLDKAESEYKTAQTLGGAGTPAFEAAAAHLARLYAAQKRYDESLAALKQAGPTGYALALGIVQSRADTLSTTLDVAQEAFTAGKSTHADFYKTAGDISAQARDLADFVIKVTPPVAFKLSHLYRVQATHLLAQQAAVLVSYIETSDPSQADKAAQLGKSAQTEMLMAHASEQKLGLWGGKQTEARN